MFYTNSSKLLKFTLGLSLVFTLSSCSDEDEAMDQMPEPTLASLEVESQVISQNMVEISLAEVPNPGWIVIHADNGNNGPVVPAIISEPKFIEAGMNQSVMVAIDGNASIEDGDQVWVMLHEDTGVDMQYEFDGNNDLDPPYIVGGAPVMSPITIEAASINTNNASVDSNNVLVLTEVVAAADGWLVVHNDNGMGGIVLPGIIGKTMVSKGVNTNVEIQLDANVMIQSGQMLFPMLHLDTGIKGQYEFDGNSNVDGPEIFGNDPFPGNVIFTSFMVQ